jgi:hypothetical protein
MITSGPLMSETAAPTDFPWEGPAAMVEGFRSGSGAASGNIKKESVDRTNPLCFPPYMNSRGLRIPGLVRVKRASCRDKSDTQP